MIEHELNPVNAEPIPAVDHTPPQLSATCGNCKHWGTPGDDQLPARPVMRDSRGIPYEVDEQYLVRTPEPSAPPFMRECQGIPYQYRSPSEIEDRLTPLPLAMVFDAEMYWAGIKTQAQFSCGLFEVKTS